MIVSGTFKAGEAFDATNNVIRTTGGVSIRSNRPLNMNRWSTTI